MKRGRFRNGSDVFWMLGVEPPPAMRFMVSRHDRPCWRFMRNRRTEPEPFTRRAASERGT